jgi:hypothetical protein
MRTVRTALLVALLAAAAPFAALARADCLGIALAGVPGPTIFADGFEGGDTLGWERPVLASFSTGATDDLGVEVELGVLSPGDHLLELRWFLPGGFLYQSMAVPFADEASPGDVRAVPGYPFPLDLIKKKPKPRPRPRPPGHLDTSGELAPDVEARLSSLDSIKKKPKPRPRPRPPGHLESPGDLVPVVEARLPLAGTSIVEAGAWGEWRVEAFLDGSDEPCTAPVAFRLET